jgi:glycosyltransferase involved in cell wall biosynthesis
MLSSYDLLCLPSAFEMSPLVIQEAFTAGIPVLASNVYGNAEQITDGLNGWLFNCNDANDLEKKLQILINKPFMLAEATKHFPVLNTFTNVANDHLKLYGSIIQNYQAH